MHPLDAADPLSGYRDLFVPSEGLVAYLDGNSLGRPLVASADRLGRFTRDEWGGRLIRGWDEGWLDLPLTLGDSLGAHVLGAASGQVAVADSTSVLIYKLVRAGLAARPGRDEIVLDRGNFPSDRYVVEGIAAERGLTIRWIEPDAASGVTPEEVADAVSERTALGLFSSVAYRSGFLADVPAITRVLHDVGALAMWDLCHSAGVVPTPLDAWGVDLAVGCGYKYLNGGPGAPAFLYVRRELQSELRQPIQGWIGSRTPFEMGQGYEPADGIRGFLSGTPPILGMQPLVDMVALIAHVGLDAIRAKSVALTEYAIGLVDEHLPDAVLASPRDPAIRGGHVTIDHPRFAELLPRLWAAGVIPDFRRPDGLRIGCSPLSTSFAEVESGVLAIRDALDA
jgi:kynureninase